MDGYKTPKEKRDKNNEYNKKNRDKLKSYRECECGTKFLYTAKTMHVNTKKHKLYIIFKENNLDIDYNKL